MNANVPMLDEIAGKNTKEVIDVLNETIRQLQAQIEALKSRKRLTYTELVPLAEQAERDSIFKVRIKPDGGISIHPMLEIFAELIEERHGIK